jgi:putative mRNA 3-end processing factor
MNAKNSLIKLNDKGLYCAAGDFYIDPWRPVRRAIVTHAHADHAYRGNGSYLVTKEGEKLYRIRLGFDAKLEMMRYGETRSINGVQVSFHPAGHVLGSAQVRVEHKGEIWCISGDYKLAPDPTCAPFEPVECHNLITEATFGLPIYRWQDTREIAEDINDWWRRNKEKGKASILCAYALGKSQRLLALIDPSIGKIFTHGSTQRLNQAYRESGVHLPHTVYAKAVEKKSEFEGSLIVAPPSALGSTWLKRFGSISTAFASGWMIVRGARRRKAVDRGFVVSDHADWEELQTAVKESKAETVFVTHGYIAEFVRWLNENGYNAKPLRAQYVGDEDEKEEEIGHGLDG